MNRNYESAVNDLNNLQSNANILDVLRKSGGSEFSKSIPEMVDYLDLLGYKPQSLDKLNIIHITGTKGKGSTSAFCDHILRSHPIMIKTGLFTSPHLMEVRERIRINGAPISKDKFADYFYYCYDRLVGKHRSEYRPHLPGPSYFRFLTLVAFHAFMEENVNAVILEVGIGGEYDSTNVISNPIACGITKLGLDHQNILGETVDKIAWHKAGIIKQGRPAVTCENQLPSALQMVQERANEKNAPLTVVNSLPQNIQLSLAGEHQRENASVAIALCDLWLRSQRPQGPLCWTDDSKMELSQFALDGLKNTKWPGRSQIVTEAERTWYLDGAHTADSVRACVDWFVDQLPSQVKKICLLYNAANGRNGLEMIDIISKKLEGVEVQLVLCPNIIYGSDGRGKADAVNHTVNKDPKLELQHQVETWWIENHPNNSSVPKVFGTIEESVNFIQSISDTNSFDHVLVTGSLHLIGGTMTMLNLPVQ